MKAAFSLQTVGVISCVLVGLVGCSIIADRRLPYHYALLAASAVAQAEDKYRSMGGKYGTLADLEIAGTLERKSFAKYRAGAVGYVFELKNVKDAFIFTAKASDPSTEMSFSVNQSGYIRTINPTRESPSLR
jgi:hypothetical protein